MTPLQRTKDAGPDNDYNTDDDWDIVYYFDYTVDSPDDYAAVNDYDFKAVLLADHQQVDIYHLLNPMVPYYRIVPYRIVLIW